MEPHTPPHDPQVTPCPHVPLSPHALWLPHGHPALRPTPPPAPRGTHWAPRSPRRGNCRGRCGWPGWPRPRSGCPCAPGDGRQGEQGLGGQRGSPPNPPPGPTLFLLLSQHCRLARIWLSMACTQASRSSKLLASKCHVCPVLDTMMNSKFSSSVGPETPRERWDGAQRVRQDPPPGSTPPRGPPHKAPQRPGPPPALPGRGHRAGRGRGRSGCGGRQARMGHSHMHEWSRPRATRHVTCFINIS